MALPHSSTRPIQCVAMKSRHLGLAVLTAATVGVLLNPLLATAVLADDKDGDVVFCLSSDQRPRLVETAVILGLAVGATSSAAAGGPPRLSPSASPTDSVSLEDWHRTDDVAFTRACTALIAASRIPRPTPPAIAGPGPIRTTINVLLPAMVGAVLSGGVALWLAKVAAGRAQAAALRTVKKNFDREAQALVYARATWVSGPRPEDAKVREARVELANQLDEIEALHPGWKEPAAIRNTLGSTTFEAKMAWDRFRASDTRADRLRDATDEIHQVMERVERLAVAAQRPYRLHLAMRKAGS
jgi:hypothetical protein